MNPEINTIADKKIIGKRIRISLADNKTMDLWKSFIPKLTTITNRVNGDLVSMSVYDDHYFKDFNPRKEFDKWAAVEVADFNNMPDDMEAFIISGGLYAVFEYKGPSNDAAIFKYIFAEWLPSSGYQLDSRPHFEILGKKYNNFSPDSEEEIWIPIKSRRSKIASII